MFSDSFHVQDIADLALSVLAKAQIEIEIAAVFLVFVAVRCYVTPLLRQSNLRSATRRVAKVPSAAACESVSSSTQVLQLVDARQGSRALQLFRIASRQGNLDLELLPAAARQKLFQGLVAEAAQTGHAEHLQELFSHLQSYDRSFSEGLVAAGVKICASRQYFSQAVMTFNVARKMDWLKVVDASVWSAVLHCALEAGGDHALQLPSLFKELQQIVAAPSKYDYGVMIRFYCRGGDPIKATQLLHEMQNTEVEIDSGLLNYTITALASAGYFDEAHQLLQTIDRDAVATTEQESAPESSHGMTISCNMIMKGYAKIGRIGDCTAVFDLMRARKVQRSQITYGILMDAYVCHNEPTKAGQLLDVMAEEGCLMNIVLYTLLIKGFVKAGEVDMAMDLYAKMRRDSDLVPDAVLFSTLIKALCDAYRLEDAIDLVAEMRALNVQPDEVIFNMLIHGCSLSQSCASSEAKLKFGKKILADMLASGIAPSDCTLSIYIRLFTECKRFAEAVEMLEQVPNVHGLSPDPRLFAQLIVACIRERQGRRAVDAYKAMLRHSSPTETTHSNVLKACLRFRMFETATDILDAAAEIGARISDQDRASVLAAAGRRVTAEHQKPVSAKSGKVSMPLWRASCSSGSAHANGRCERASLKMMAVVA